MRARGGLREQVEYVPSSHGASSAGLDPTKKIGKQVGWLNRYANLQASLSFSDVVGPLSQLDVAVAMKILKDLEEVSETVENPTGYVNAAAGRASGGGGSPRQGGPTTVGLPPPGRGVHFVPVQRAPSMEIDPTGKIARQVGWLNRHADLVESISFSDVVEPLSRLDVTVAMSVLKDLQERGSHLQDPTQYVLDSAARKAGVSRQPMLAMVPHPMKPAPRQVPRQVPRQEPRQANDPTGKIARQVGWLNRNADFQENLSFTDVVEPLSQIDVTVAMSILKDLEGQAAHVRNPTGYVTAAAARAGADSGMLMPPMQPLPMVAPGGPPPRQQARGPSAASFDDQTVKIQRQVGWLNKYVEMNEDIYFDEVVEPLSQLDITLAMRILKEVETEGGQVGDPTQFILERCEEEMGGVAPRALASSPVATDPTGKIGKQVGWLNKNADLVEAISYTDVVELLSSLDLTAAMRILKDVQEKALSLKTPTGFIIKAARDAKGRGAAGSPLGSSMLAAMPPRPAAHASNGGRAKRPWNEDTARPSEGNEDSKQIARIVGRINKTVDMAENLSYSDVKPHLEACGVEAATKILKDLEQSAASIKIPTQYVIAAAKRASAGDSIPAKRQRM